MEALKPLESQRVNSEDLRQSPKLCINDIESKIDDELKALPEPEEKMDVSSHDDCSGQSRHVLDVIGTNAKDGSEQMTTLIHQAVLEQLKYLGVEFEPPATRGRTKVRKSNSIKPGRTESGFNRLVDVHLARMNVTFPVPLLIQQACKFLRNHIDTEGIFRKSGSNSRVQALMKRFSGLEKDEEFSFAICDTVFDVATALKQYLREMDAPVIPYDLHGLFRMCLQLSPETLRDEAVLLCTCLLPACNLRLITYLAEFLLEVVEHCPKNKMSFENLAIVIGPNVIPVETRKCDKVKELELERKFLEAHTKIMEIFIRNGHRVGCLPSDLETKVHSEFSLRGSEDELENEAVTRRKKRRSGSLTRVLGFLKKVASSKTGEASVPQTPVDFPVSGFSHTPVMKSSSKRRCLDENIFSLQKKKTILDGIRKNGLVVKDDDKRFSHITDTPNSITGFITCPSPVCLNPSPLKMDWKNTPNAARFKNLVTPSLLRRKEKPTELTKAKLGIAPFSAPAKPAAAPFSAPAKPSKSRIGLGKRSSKKRPPITVLTENNGLRREVKRLSPSVSIHKLATSPRKVARASSTRIPRPDKPIPIRKSSSSCRFPLTSDEMSFSKRKNDLSNMSGEYVKLSPSAQVRDVRNEAFIASKLSCMEDFSMDNEGENDAHGLKPETKSTSIRLTPLIQEINTLTLTAQEELTLSALRKKRSVAILQTQQAPSVEKPPPVPSRTTRRRSSGASSNKARLRSPPDSSVNKSLRCEGQENKTPTDAPHSQMIRQVEAKFRRAIKETKIMRIQSERSTSANPRAVQIHRRFSIQARGVSPSQRLVISNASRRRSQENRTSGGMVTPLTDLARSGHQTDSMVRSPNRCTLKRGRPNTLRTGLARPSPAPSTRNNSVVTTEESLKESPRVKVSETIALESSAKEEYAATPLRRMSSVQEMVKLMDKERRNKSGSNIAPVDSDIPSLKPANINRTESPPPKRNLTKRSSSSKFVKPAIPTPKKKGTTPTAKTTPRQVVDLAESDTWVPATNFSFESHRSRFLNDIHNEDRDSIQALKTLNAGKVSENVRLFNGMSRTRKSPGKSLIPRYVALHRQESFKN